MKKTVTILFFVIFSKVTIAQISNTSFAPKVDYTSGVGTLSNPSGIITADLDNDDKVDLVVGNMGSSSISVFRNTSNLSNIQLSNKVDFSNGVPVSFVYKADIDGDGKIDIITTSNSGNIFSIYKNTTTSVGNITFATRQDIVTLPTPGDLEIEDVDGDNKNDIICTNYSSNSFSVFRNLSTAGNIIFDTRLDYNCNNNPSSIAVFDMDGDLKKDIAITYYTTEQLGVFKNTTTSIGNPSFSSIVTFSTPSYPAFLNKADLDGDGKKEMVISSLYGHNITVFKNTSTGVNSLSFQSGLNISSGTGLSYCQGITLTDLDNDSKIDISVCNRGNNTLSVFKNISTTGVINSSSFANQVLFLVNESPYDIFATDLNGDGKVDIGCTNNGSNNISILKNQIVFTGLENILSNEYISISPVPMKNDLNINIENNEKLVLVSIYDINGKLILELNNQNKIDVSGLLNGVYTIKVITDKQSFIEKIIK